MKRIIAALTLSAIIIVCCICGVSITNKCTDKLSLIANECMESYYDSSDESLKKVTLLKKKLTQYQPLLFMFSNRETVEELEDAICKMEFSVNSDNDILFLEEYYNINTSIRKLKEAQRLSIECFL